MSQTDRQDPHQREFSLPADPNAIPPVVDAVIDFLDQQQCDPDDAAAVALALQEALSNAVVHGCRKDPTKTVYCSVACNEGGEIVVVVRDPGPGFDPAAIPTPLRPEGLTEDHGRGLHLMRNLMDEVSFEHNGTQVVMRKS